MDTTTESKNGTSKKRAPKFATRASLTTDHPQPPTGSVTNIDGDELRKTIGDATSKATAQITIPPLRFAEFAVPIRCVPGSPYLVAGWTEKAIRMMEDAMTKSIPKPAKGMREKRDPKAEFEAYKTRNAKGQECIPALHIKCAMVNAGIRSTTGVYKGDLRAAIFVRADDGLIPFTYARCEMRRDMVRNKSGQPDIRWRPEYHDWTATIRLRINLALITVAGAVNLLRLAGSMVGIGEWRIEKGGEHGAFEVAL